MSTAKALVLAGGEGKRLRPLTYSGPKQLVPVANRPILFFVIDSVVEAGVRDIGLVVAPETRAAVAAAAGDGSAWGARITYIEQDRPGGLAHAVRVARPFLGDDSFLMVLGDNLIGASLAPFVRAFDADEATQASLLLKEVEDPRRFGVAAVDASGKVLSLIEKPRVPPSNLALVGVYLFKRSIHDVIDTLVPSERGELEITDAANALMQRSLSVTFERLDGFWLDTGKKDDLLLANETILGARLRPKNGGSVCAESRLEGPVRIEAGARIVRSRVVGPVVVGAGATLEDAEVGPFVAVGDHARVERSRVARSVLLEACSVEDAGTITGSLIGKRAAVRGVTERAASLVVGDDCSIDLPRTEL